MLNTFIYVIKSLNNFVILSFFKGDMNGFFDTKYSIIINFICFAKGGIAKKNINIRFKIKFIYVIFSIENKAF